MRTTSEIKKAINTICANAAKLQDKIAAVAVECLEHAQAHGDATLMLYLCQQLPKGQRAQALKLWVTAFSPIKLQTDTEGNFVGVKLAKQGTKNFVAWDLEGAKETPYFSFTKENEPKPLTFEAIKKIIAGLSKRYERAENEGLVPADEADLIKDYIRAVQSVSMGASIPATIQ